MSMNNGSAPPPWIGPDGKIIVRDGRSLDDALQEVVPQSSDQNPNPITGTLMVDEAHYQFACQQLRQSRCVVGSGPGDDYRHNDPVWQNQLVVGIMNAILNVEAAEGATAKSGNPSPAIVKLHRLSRMQLEIEARRIMYAVRDTQQGRTGFHPAVLDIPDPQIFESFTDRMEEVLRGLRENKNVFKQIMDADFLSRFTLNPSAELGKKGLNRVSNNSKAGRLQGYKETQQGNKRASQDDSTPQTPAKKRKRGANTSAAMASPQPQISVAPRQQLSAQAPIDPYTPPVADHSALLAAG
ncbi:hypothetical protein MKZ38_010801 [Zalerion maritima]|uniref:Uncharacterized protein n=1 Tax=Zalerion maritima TaxID=339359 RepID=A0AAD5WXA2_9PEZI|nr:hypothetical protein MKZ38_010801 [Zalerion maritima]